MMSADSLTPGNRIVLEKLAVAPIVEKFTAFYGRRRFIAMFTLSVNQL
jgi:hypothetical protein